MKVQDIQISDVALKQEFVGYFNTGNYQSALNLITNNPQLDRKAFVADILNAIGANLLATENLYYNNVEDVLATDLATFNLLIKTWVQTTWSSIVVYKKYNFVTYNSQVYMYNNDTPTSGNLPTDATYWVFIGLKGEDGAVGLDLNLRYAWSSNVQYSTKDLIYYQQAMYVALQPNINQIPSAASAYWEVFRDIPKASIYINQNPPTATYIGNMWYGIVN